MRLIKNLEQLISNIKSVENYFADGSENDKIQISGLISKGKCLVAYKVNSEIRFAPSRFLGYIDNELSKHIKSTKAKSIDGRETNVLITRVLESKLHSNEELEVKYIQYCKNLGVEPSNYSKRRYWYFKLENDFTENKEVDGLFPEGKIVERIHKSRERNSRVIEIAKANFKLNHGKLFCQVCGFDFEKKYGKIGVNFIEAHHTIPVSSMAENHITAPEDIAMLCANCHRMVHKKRPWLTMSKITSIIK
jgi:predicted HNH restriction endonuclease